MVIAYTIICIKIMVYIKVFTKEMSYFIKEQLSITLGGSCFCKRVSMIPNKFLVSSSVCKKKLSMGNT